jgi:N utilization substance protein B
MDPDSSPSSSHGAPHKNTRREAREMALRMLFQIDVGGQAADEVIITSLEQSVLEGANREFAEAVVRGTLDHLKDIDRRIQELTEDWALDRQAAVDRNILRMTAFEILFPPETPVAAVINEAIELAKKYSTNESGRFVNGVLGALARKSPRGAEPLTNAESPTDLDILDEPLEGAQPPKRSYRVITRSSKSQGETTIDDDSTDS